MCEAGEGENGSGFYEPIRPAARAGAGRKGAKQMDVYAIITEKIVDLLEQGVVPWRKPWTAIGLPRNLVSKKPYRGVNLLLLSATEHLSPYWATMRQVNEQGGRIRRGEESTLIVYWQTGETHQNAEDGADEETKKKPQRRFLLRYYRSWNLEQCEMPQSILDKLPKTETRQHEPIAAAERIIAGMPNRPEIHRGGSQAFYSPLTDRITLPPRELFDSAEAEMAVVYHEISHYADFRIMPRCSSEPSQVML